MNLKVRPKKWNSMRVRYELSLRGKTIKGLAVESGVSAASLRMAFCRPSVKVNTIIAKTLRVPLHELWPDWFDNDGELIPAKYRRKLSRQRESMASHESRDVQGA